jgi:rod shape-determining protein MreD
VIYYFALPVLALSLVVFQTSILEALLFNKMGLEITFLCVIYAGLYMDAWKGCLMSFVLGFMLDSLTASVTGIYTIIYVVMFFITMQVAPRVYKTNIAFIMIFTMVCAVFKMLVLVFIYQLIFDANVLVAGLSIYLPQAVILSLISPAFFTLCHRFEEWFHGGIRRSA